ncbi:hypothetical protein ACGFOU_02595 [Streptomyces sp. NPDC048595]|uniref:hypothetical protein n=1 Tax=Streptomyces sp. NPDC048595 TaxID=3365576 RepID=UPI003718FF3B
MDEIAIELSKLGALPLPEGFADDYSAGTLPVLEAAAIAYLEQGGNTDLLVRGLGAHLGEAILCTAGGRWEWSGCEEGDPVVVVDPVHGAGPVDVCGIVRRALDEATGEVFAEEHGWMEIAAAAQADRDPSWRPVKEVDGVERPRGRG